MRLQKEESFVISITVVILIVRLKSGQWMEKVVLAFSPRNSSNEVKSSLLIINLNDIQMRIILVIVVARIVEV